MASALQRRRNRGLIAAMAGVALSIVTAPAVGARDAPPAMRGLAGVYDGSQMEMGVGLRLQPNGRFDYQLAYGALDESASGTWTRDRDHVFLTSDPVTPPKFSLIDQRPSADGKMHVVLDLPKGWSRQYFDAELELSDGRGGGGQLSDDSDIIELEPGDRPVSLRLEMGVYALHSDAFRIGGTGPAVVHVRFDPNDIGKVAFAKTPLRIVGKTLTFERYGRSIVFRRTNQRWETG